MNSPVKNLSCNAARENFSAYLDGAVSGAVMLSLAHHLNSCAGCTAEFTQWREMQQALSALGPAKAPDDLALRLRIALSRQQTRMNWLDRMKLAWGNTVAPLALQASAGFASAVLLLGTVVLLLGVVSAPEQAVANDGPSGAATAPRFLYSSVGGDAEHVVAADGSPIIVQALVNANGDIYDYRIVSGSVTDDVHAQLENKLLFSKFEPATLLGQPTRGRILLSFTGISVRG